MVKLIVDDFDQVTMLEHMLTQKDIPYELELSDRFCREYGIRPPHLIVDGVPLDFNRSMKWIKGYVAHE